MLRRLHRPFVPDLSDVLPWRDVFHLVPAAAVLSDVLAQYNRPGMPMDSENHEHEMETVSMPRPMTPGIDMNSMASAIGSLTKLSGRSFDRAYLSLIIPHHVAAVAMAGAVLPLSNDDQVES
jgi:uncharacterized protein (DUF305 family)